MHNFKVSVITVCYNAVKSIEDTITSVLSQTYRDIEYIIIDAESTDGTLDVINKYKSSIAILVCEKDKGIYDAMNKGIRLATGDIVYILNSDDSLCDENVISYIVDEFKKYPQADLLYGKIKYIDLPEYFSLPSPQHNYLIKAKRDFIKKMICHQAVFARKNLFNKIGLLETKYKVCADYNWLLSVFSQPDIKTAYVDRYIANYYCQGASFKNRYAYISEKIRINYKYFSFLDFLAFLLYFAVGIISIEKKKIELFFARLKRHSKKMISFPVALNLIKYRFSRPSPILSYGPLSLTLWISDRCNLNCEFCLRNKTAVDFRYDILPEMTMETFKKIMPMFKTAYAISFMGQGEPLLNKNFFEMVEYAGRFKKTMRLVTNGVLLDERMCGRIMISSLDTIDVSLKACSAEDFQKITRCPAPDYEMVLNGIKSLIKLRQQLKTDKKIAVSYVLYKSRLSDLPKAIELAESLKADMLHFLNFIPFGAFDSGGDKEILFDDDKEVKALINKLKKIPRNLHIEWPVLLRKNNYYGYCSSNFSNLCIDSAGNIGFCDRVLPPSKEYGNIFTDKDVWNAECFVQMRACLLSANKDSDLPLRCKLCVDMSGDKSRAGK